jgi:dipeptidyl aminopeptidase/acylaminoacyl peptidase
MDPEDLRSFWGIPDWETTDKHLFRMDLNNYISLKDERFEILYRKDAFKSEDEYITYSKSVSPFHLLDQAKTYPPTFVLHGTGDSAVPVEQSYKFVEALKGRGVQVDARYKEGGEHCFENKIEVSSA